MKTKVSYYLSHPIQYFSPLLKLMAEEFDLEVYYFSNSSITGNYDVGFNQNVKWDLPLLEGYNYTFLKNISGRKSMSNRLFDVVNPSVISTIYKRKPQIVIVNGWSYFSSLLTILTSRVFGKKIWLRAENPLNQELTKNSKKIFIKKIFLKYILFPSIHKFLYIGSESNKFFEYYGVPAHKLVFTPYSVDNKTFIKIADENQNKKTILRKELNLPEDSVIILFSGKYIEKKRPLDLIKAFHLLNNPNSFLVMAGEGKLRGEMEDYISKNNVQNILLTGFINQSAISKYYSAANIFVMCSGTGETWGLSVNEAMCFSLPVIVSSTCGCSEDLVRNNINGFSFPEGNIDELSKYMDTLVSNKKLREEFGKASLNIINNYNNEIIVENMKKAC